MNRISAFLGRSLVHYINQPVKSYEPFAIFDPATLAAVLEPGDVLLVEGNRRISSAIKYLNLPGRMWPCMSATPWVRAVTQCILQ